MRYTDRIAFATEVDSVYDSDAGEYTEGEPITDIKPCNISQLGVERSVKLFGEIDTDMIVARLQRPYDLKFDYIEVSGVRYNVRKHTRHRSESVFFLEGMRT